MQTRFAGWRRLLLAALCASAGLIATPDAKAAGPVIVTEVDGAIGVATTRHVAHVLKEARERNASAVLLRLNTPGGLVTSTREIVRDIVASPVPVIVYVGPSGARAASAGTFIVYAAHLAAMAPGTNLGAATPISMGGLPNLPGDKDKKDNEPSAAEKKSINDTVAMLRSLAQMRGRNVDFAEKAVRDAATLTASEAHRDNVVELLAPSTGDLLAQAAGRKLTAAGVERTLDIAGAEQVTIAPDWRTRLLAVIADPNIVVILLLLGIYGILFEFWSPGALFPGVIGGICLILAFTALSVLPVQYGALGLLLLGIALMIGEAFTPGIGALGIGGAVAFVLGALFLFEGDASDFDLRVSIPVIVGAVVACAGFSFFVLGAAVKARRRPAVTGAEEMIGGRGTVTEWNGHDGLIRIHGEIWSARAASALRAGDAVRVTARDGLTLTVEPQ